MAAPEASPEAAPAANTRLEDIGSERALRVRTNALFQKPQSEIEEPPAHAPPAHLPPVHEPEAPRSSAPELQTPSSSGCCSWGRHRVGASVSVDIEKRRPTRLLLISRDGLPGAQRLEAAARQTDVTVFSYDPAHMQLHEVLENIKVLSKGTKYESVAVLAPRVVELPRAGGRCVGFRLCGPPTKDPGDVYKWAFGFCTWWPSTDHVPDGIKPVDCTADTLQAETADSEVRLPRRLGLNPLSRATAATVGAARSLHARARSQAGAGAEWRPVAPRWAFTAEGVLERHLRIAAALGSHPPAHAQPAVRDAGPGRGDEQMHEEPSRAGPKPSLAQAPACRRPAPSARRRPHRPQALTGHSCAAGRGNTLISKFRLESTEGDQMAVAGLYFRFDGLKRWTTDPYGVRETAPLAQRGWCDALCCTAAPEYSDPMHLKHQQALKDAANDRNGGSVLQQFMAQKARTEASERTAVTISTLVHLYSIVAATLLLLFVPQKGLEPHQVLQNLRGLPKGALRRYTFFLNLGVCAALVLGQLVKLEREQWLIKHLARIPLPAAQGAQSLIPAAVAPAGLRHERGLRRPASDPDGAARRSCYGLEAHKGTECVPEAPREAQFGVFVVQPVPQPGPDRQLCAQRLRALRSCHLRRAAHRSGARAVHFPVGPLTP